MAPNDSPRNRREREVTRQRQERAAAEAYQRARRRQAAVGIGVVAFVLLAVFGIVRAATSENSKGGTTTTVAGATTTSAYTGPTAALPEPAPGSTLVTPASCPPLDGSAPRITKFAGPPPTCLDPSLEYAARIRTNRGTMVVQVETDAAPAAANNFVFLALHHYYDGLPFSQVRRGAFASVADPVNEDGSTGPGYTLPAGNDKQGILTPVSVVMTPGPEGITGGLTIGMPGPDFTQIPENAPRIGTIMSNFTTPRQGDRTVQMDINDAATPSGAPTEVIMIEGIEVLGCRAGDKACTDRAFAP